MGCIETFAFLFCIIPAGRLTLTWDVLKQMNEKVLLRTDSRLTLTWDVLKRSTNAVVPGFVPGLTLTWDVLKRGNKEIKNRTGQRINFNMGCIETYHAVSGAIVPAEINFNMGCIETIVFHLLRFPHRRLTLTWDVLKPTTVKNWQ